MTDAPTTTTTSTLPATTTTATATTSTSNPATTPSLKILSFNVRSLSRPETQRRVLSYLLSLSPRPDAFLLQEHHLLPHQQRDLSRAWLGAAHFSQHCATLIPESSILNHLPTSTVTANSNRTLTTTFQHPTKPVQLINVYAPVNAQTRLAFFTTLTIPQAPTNSLKIIGGDLNDCPDLNADRKNQAHPTTHWTALVNALASARFPFVDAIRYAHPAKSHFTHPHRNARKEVVSWSRIDYLLIPPTARSSLLTANTLFDAPASDHRPITITIAFSLTATNPTDTLPTTSAFQHRLNPLTFTTDDFRQELDKALTRVGVDAGTADRWEEEKGKLVHFARTLSRRLHLERLAEQRSLSTSLMLLESLPAPLSPTDQEQWTLATARLRQLALTNTRLLNTRAHIPDLDSDQDTATAAAIKIKTRLKNDTFTTIRHPDPTLPPTADLSTALTITHDHFQRHYSPSPTDPTLQQHAQDNLLHHLDHPPAPQDPRLARRLPRSKWAALSAPFTPREVLFAIDLADKGHSPGPSGIPYEMYKAEAHLFAPTLAAAFNNTWNRKSLSPTMASATVRLLFKHNKPNADRSNLNHYRPITLCETDYKLLTKIVVARLNSVIGTILPPVQHGFMPRKQASDLGLYATLLVEEIAARSYPTAALVSLDQRSAYDLVDHGWIQRTFSAFDFPPRFLDLLDTIYDSTRLIACYNINGFLTNPVRLLIGLGQGDPASCAVFNIVFQPFLDALLIRKIALQLSHLSPLPQTEILSHFAFADDVLLAVASAGELELIRRLGDDWKTATNGEFNHDKTEATAIGPDWLTSPDASSIATRHPEDPIVFAGYPIALDHYTNLAYSTALNRLKNAVKAATTLRLTPSAAARFANTYLVSRLHHLLAFDVPPSWFTLSADTVLRTFVRGGAYHFVADSALSLPTQQGGLGLILPSDLATTTALKIFDAVAGGSSPSWRLLALSSLQRSSATRDVAAKVWSFLTTSHLPFSNERWVTVFRATQRNPPTLRLDRLRPSDLLLLPPSSPSLFSTAPPHLSTFTSTYQLYLRRDSPSSPLLPLTPPPLFAQSRPLHSFTTAASENPLLARLLPTSTTPPIPLPNPTLPRPSSFTLYDLPRPFSAAELRQKVAEQRHSTARRGQFWLRGLGDKEIEDFWKWLRGGDPGAREKDTVWRLVYGATPVRQRLVHQGRADSPICPLCSQGAVETVEHYFFDCDESRHYWQLLSPYLDKLLPAPLLPPLHLLPPLQLVLGLPSLRSTLDKPHRRRLRSFFGVAFQELHLARWRTHDGHALNVSTTASMVQRRIQLQMDSW